MTSISTRPRQTIRPPRGARWCEPRRLGRWLGQRASSSLTRRIVVLNLAGLVALLVGFLYLNQFRQGLIEARVLSLMTQGEIIAGAIASSATVETDTITIDPDQLLQMQAGDTARFAKTRLSPRILDQSGAGRAAAAAAGDPDPDPCAHLRPGGLAAARFPHLLFPRRHPAHGPAAGCGRAARPSSSGAGTACGRCSATKKRLVLEEVGPANGKSLPEVQRAFAGERSSEVRTNARGETIVSVAVPIQRFRSVQGVLLLSTQGGDIDAIIASERFALLQVFLVAAVVMIVLSLFLAGAIAGPVRRLAEAAERVRRGTKSRQEIPDFTSRVGRDRPPVRARCAT